MKNVKTIKTEWGREVNISGSDEQGWFCDAGKYYRQAASGVFLKTDNDGYGWMEGGERYREVKP